MDLGGRFIQHVKLNGVIYLIQKFDKYLVLGYLGA